MRLLVATSTAISTGILPLRLESLPFLKNLIAKTLTRTCVLETDAHIYIYISSFHKHD